ncbi:MAG: hypothetical protein WC637_12250, partial [Victivallales bacterium]
MKDDMSWIELFKKLWTECWNKNLCIGDLLVFENPELNKEMEWVFKITQIYKYKRHTYFVCLKTA